MENLVEQQEQRSGTYRYAKRELDILFASENDLPKELVENIKSDILELCENFGNAGHSNSTYYAAPAIAHEEAARRFPNHLESRESFEQLLNNLLLQQPISPLTGNDDEWVDVSDLGDDKGGIVYQNSRDGRVFKNADGTAWFLEAISWVESIEGERVGINGAARGKDGTVFQSHWKIKEFPFEPKKFEIDVITFDGDRIVSNDLDLEPVFEIYEPMPTK